MKHYFDAVLFPRGPAPNPAITVYVAGTNQSVLATIYSDNGVTLKANPLKKLLFLLLTSAAFAQGARVDLPPILNPRGTPVSNASISLCPGTATITGSSCSPATATGFTDITLGTACIIGSPVVLTGTNTCQATGDSLGNAGFWLSPGAYIYCITAPGVTGKCFNLTAPVGATSSGASVISSPLLLGGADTGLSRTAAATVAVGNGTQGDASGTVKLAAIQGPGIQKQIFTSSGTFTIPAGITQSKVTLVGGGGGGANTNASGTWGAGGQGAAFAIKYLAGLTPGNTITVTVGTGGAGSTDGTSSAISSGTQTITTVIAINGRGAANNSQPGNLIVGTSTNGDINGQTTPGGPGQSSTPVTGIGGSTIFGGGGFAVGAAGTNGTNGVNPGSGGGGSASAGAAQTGGTGANGIVIFEWVS